MDPSIGDGETTTADADVLHDYAAKLFAKTDTVSKTGLGSYSANVVHGPVAHIDGGDLIARWGR